MIAPPTKVLFAGISFNTIQTHIGAIIVSIIISKLTSLAGNSFVPIPIKTLDIGDTNIPAIINIKSVFKSNVKFLAKKKETTALANPAKAVIAKRSALLY